MVKKRPVIHFAHANGFPSLVYSKLLGQLKSYGYDVIFIEKIGHQSHYPITENWPYLIDELIASIEQQANEPVIALGHSLGGLLSFMAAIKRPDLFQAVIGLDAFWFNKIKLKMLYFSKILGWIQRSKSAIQAKKRRSHWKTEVELNAYFHSKNLFKRLDPDCLNDYLYHGIKKDDSGYSLAFEKEKERQIYCTPPHQFSLFKGKQDNVATVPTALIYGQQSDWLKSMGIRAAEKQYERLCFGMKGTHMFPLEHPLECAEKIHEVVRILSNFCQT